MPISYGIQGAAPPCPLPTLSADACALQCSSLEGAVGYVWAPPSAVTCPSACSCKASWSEGVATGDAGWVSALLGPPPHTVWAGVVFQGDKLPSGDVCGGTQATSVATCAQHCAEIADCK